MKSSTNTQIIERFEWLYQVKNKEISLTPAQINLLETTKKFCTLEVPGKFTSISYNSLKKYCPPLKLPFHLRTSEAIWSHLLRLREDAYKSTIALQSDSIEIEPEQLLTEMSRHMHRYETAYFSLFREIRSIVESDPNLPDLSRKRLIQILSQSKAIHMTSFANPARYDESATLKIIDGGKL